MRHYIVTTILVTCFTSSMLSAAFPVDEKLLEDAPTIGLGLNTGCTSYIDFLQASDFPQGINLVRFVDCAKRKGFAIRFQIRHVAGECKLDKCDGDDFVTAFFQRYTGRDDYWVSAESHCRREISLLGKFDGALNKAQFEKLLRGEVVEYAYRGGVYWIGLAK